ncbi:SHOCT domain-containing protein [Mycobacterium sp. Y57]|uniref:SHOCT domain-containing protein n=1 Tax=Mycolicibacterium xanthum TaxID=2796469 RepID=UPI001C852CB5|nr:SHOCT domain-containing protein [Mycolicibacterium xanthum]MBX7431155.1 SHOCT domain-containing protein [Mycolicibacterium xanthum]
MWDTFWHFLWSMIVIFAVIAYLMILFSILVDLFWRDQKTSGWVKAVWVIFLIVLPYLTALVYLIARGGGMAERAREQAMQAKKETDDYIKQAAGRSPAQEIADAKALLESGAITQAEFESLKAKALS